MQLGKVAEAMLKLGDFTQQDGRDRRPSTAVRGTQYAYDREMAQLKIRFYQTFGYWPDADELDMFIEEGM